jgi:hypothetical protein
MNYSSYPNQGWTSLCGPASFFYCLQMDRPDVYKQAVNELWLHGKTKIEFWIFRLEMDAGTRKVLSTMITGEKQYQVWTGLHWLA